nr:digestive cysteine proteinase 1-like [Parasteatoda tepidariorum]
MKYLAIFAFIAVATALKFPYNPQLNEHWENFKRIYGKNYGSREEFSRRLIWERAVTDIIKHNLQADLGIHSYRKGINEYADMSHEEFVRHFNGFKSSGLRSGEGSAWVEPSNVHIPDTVDWRKQGLVTPIKNQDGPKCLFNKANVGATVTGYVDIPTGDENALKTAVATVGPVSVAIDASNFSFQLYQDGIYDESSCSTSQLDHGVLAIGYGTEDGQDYWLVKNSWGTTWGIQGYIKMSRNKGNQCGIATQASYPLV